MMRLVAICSLLLAVVAGCNRTTEAQQNAASEQAEQQEEETPSRDGDAATFSHVVAREAEYYVNGPQQGRPPDGTLPEGTRVNVVRDSGSYLVVRSEEGVEAYVAANAVEPLDSPAKDVSGVVEVSNRFALDLYRQLRSEQGNLFFSPTSISTALAMTYAGAEGETQAEMVQTLHFQMPEDQLHEGMQALQASWKTPAGTDGIKLNLANRLWGQQSYEFLPEFLKVTRNRYGAQLARLDFAQQEQARQTINRWVEEQTENKITDLLPSGAISSETRLVLTNAVYFHGNWAEPFDEDRTEPDDFQLSGGGTAEVPMMHRSDEFRYGAVEDLQLLELPYADGCMSMIVLLPRSVDGLADLEAGLTPENLQRWTGSLKREDEVKVYLPRFQMTSQFELSGTLGAMGMPSAFEAGIADFSGMTGNKDLFLSAAIHKAFVDVNEKGTEAAAATGAVAELVAVAEDQPPVFRADHPFVFLIRENRSGAFLFLGRVTNPLE